MYTNQRSRKRATDDATIEGDRPTKAPRTQDDSTIKRLDPAGDVILEFQDKSRIQVSSRVLSFASKAFAAMFTSRYLEGQNLNSQNPPTIVFPDDDPRAFDNLCLLLYHEEDNVEFGFWDCKAVREEEQLIKILILADKYDCIRAIKSQVALMFRDVIAETLALFHLGEQGSSNIFDCLLDAVAASYLLGDARLFWEVTGDVVYKSGPVEKLTTSAKLLAHHLVPPTLWVHLSEQRAAFRGWVFGRILQLHRKYVGAPSSGTFRYQDLSYHLKSVQPLSTFDEADFGRILQLCETSSICIYEVIESLRKDVDASVRASKGEASQSKQLAFGAAFISFAGFVVKDKKALRGLCLYCTKQGDYPAEAWKKGLTCDHKDQIWHFTEYLDSDD